MSTRPQHCALEQLSVENDELIVGNKPVTVLAEQVGQTPFYAYDRAAITNRIQYLRSAMPPRLSIHYAIKANPMPAVVGHVAPLVDGLDIASLGEMHIAIGSETPATEISFAGPGKRDAELSSAIAAGVTLNIESSGELERTARIGDALGIRPRVAIRVNPDFELKSSGMKMAGGAKQFGIDAEFVPTVLGRIEVLGLHFRGFHIFSGSQNLRAESLAETQTATFELAYRLANSAPGPVESLNIGGGYGIPYFPGEEALDLGPVADNLAIRMEECVSRLGDTEIILELGRYLVGEAGYYVTRAIDKKTSRGELFVITDGGLHHHLAASGNFGQIIRKNYPVVAGTCVSAGTRETVNVVGPLCTPLDLLAKKMEIGRVDVGDLIVVLQSGAYGYTASPHGFLSHPEPMEVLV